MHVCGRDYMGSFCIVVIVISIIKGLDPEKIMVLNSKSTNVTRD